MNRQTLKILLVLFAGFFAACIDSRPPKITKVMDGPIDLPARQGFINDYARVIDDSTIQKLESELLAFKEKTNVDFVIVIVNSKDGFSIEKTLNGDRKTMVSRMSLGRLRRDTHRYCNAGGGIPPQRKRSVMERLA